MKEIVIKWTPTDIKWAFDDWEQSKCQEAFDDICKHLGDRVVELGNEVLEQLAREWNYDKEIEEENND
jgi:hypothetical protein